MTIFVSHNYSLNITAHLYSHSLISPVKSSRRQSTLLIFVIFLTEDIFVPLTQQNATVLAGKIIPESRTDSLA